MEEIKNKMGESNIKKLIVQMGLPMILSMILQAVYNIVDTAFVINMPGGEQANLALTYAFHVQIFMIALGVGTGIGLNTMLSKSLGEKDYKKAGLIAGNSVLLGIIYYLIFFIFGLTLSGVFVAMQANGNPVSAEMGKKYLLICCVFSFGSIGYAIYERFLQSSGKTLLSTIAQISGAATNIILDYVFIYICDMGITGAAVATVIGQILSLIVAMIFHHTLNTEVKFSLKDLHLNGKVVKGIYKTGISATIMQALLSVMMLGMNIILLKSSKSAILQGSFGIYYKIMQFALFATFGLSNTIITLLSYNYGRKDKKRCLDVIKYGIIYTCILALIITFLFEVFSDPLSRVFKSDSQSGEIIILSVKNAIMISVTGYVFMGFNVAVQGILQAEGYSYSPLIIAFLRLCVFVFVFGAIFSGLEKSELYFWFCFPLSEVLTSVVSLIFLKKSLVKKIYCL